MECRVTVLCENTVSMPGLIGEHGFAAYIETLAGNLLFDTGQGFSLIQNSLKLNRDLRSITGVALSHGHFDHTGGLLALLGLGRPFDITAHPDVTTERYWTIVEDGQEKTLSIGLPWPEAYLTTRGARFRWEREFNEVLPNVFITGEVPRTTLFELGSPKFAVRGNGNWAPDPFLDDYSLVLKTSRGLVIVLGCAHAGIINILKHCIAKTGEERIHAVLGGTHLGLSPEPQLNPTVQALKEYDIDILAVSHCTGQGPIAGLAAQFGKKFAFGSVGFTLEV